MKKTNAIRILDKMNIKYETIEYSTEGDISGRGVAEKTGEELERVFKTLVTKSDHDIYVFVIPSTNELDLKKAARAVGAKKIEMLPSKDLFKNTGYVHGGCSPIGMNKLLPTYINESAKDLDFIYVSGGKIGLQIKINPLDLADLIEGKFEDLV